MGGTTSRPDWFKTSIQDLFTGSPDQLPAQGQGAGLIFT